MIVTWKSRSWSKQCQIFRDRIIIGILRKQRWSGHGYGEFNGAMLRFRSKGLFRMGAVIYDIEGQRELGGITFNRWRSSASITYEGQVYEWKYGSWKRNAWVISNGLDYAKYRNTDFWRNEGVIEIEYLHPAIVLTGLYIQECFKAL
jgi:hypothetical protein